MTQVTLHPDRIHVEAEEMLASGVTVLVNVVFLLTTGAVLSWEVPASWNDADNSIEVIGGGGAGARQRRRGDAGGKGGGGGAYSRVVNINLTPLAMRSIPRRRRRQRRARDGGDSWFGAATFGAAIVAAKGGQGGIGRTRWRPRRAGLGRHRRCQDIRRQWRQTVVTAGAAAAVLPAVRTATARMAASRRRPGDGGGGGGGADGGSGQARHRRGGNGGRGRQQPL